MDDMINQDEIFCPFSVRLPTRYGEFEVVHFEFWDTDSFQFSHKHNCYELHYCLKGKLNIKFKRGEVTLEANHCLIVAPNVLHEIFPKEDVEYFSMCFTNSLKNPIRKNYCDDAFFARLEYGLTDDSVFHIIEDHYDCEDIIERIKKEITHKYWAYKLLLGNLCSDLLFLTLRNLSSDLFDGKDMVAYPDNYNLPLLVNKYIAKNYLRTLTLESVAERFHISTRQLIRILADYYGKSFNDILSFYRLEEAKKLLQKTDKSLEEIAYHVGFSSVRSLYNLFNKYDEARTPNYYRKAHKEK